METRIAELRGKYADDREASAILDRLAEEPEVHRRYSAFYAYEFFVARCALARSHPAMTEAREQDALTDALPPAAPVRLPPDRGRVMGRCTQSFSGQKTIDLARPCCTIVTVGQGSRHGYRY